MDPAKFHLWPGPPGSPIMVQLEPSYPSSNASSRNFVTIALIASRALGNSSASLATWGGRIVTLSRYSLILFSQVFVTLAFSLDCSTSFTTGLLIKFGPSYSCECIAEIVSFSQIRYRSHIQFSEPPSMVVSSEQLCHQEMLILNTSILPFCHNFGDLEH